MEKGISTRKGKEKLFMDLAKKDMIGEILIARGIISRAQLNTAIKLQESAVKTGEALMALGIVSSHDLDIALGWQLAEIIVGLGYAGEREVFGSLRYSVVAEKQNPYPVSQYNNREVEDFSDL